MAGVSAGYSAGVPGMGSCCSSCEQGRGCEAKRIPATPTYAVGRWGHVVHGVPGMGASPLSLVPPIGIQLSFPPVSATWQPGQTEPVQQSGSPLGDWFTRHVIRPKVSVGGVMVDPYSDYADYSGVAQAIAIGLLAAGTLVGAVTLGRAVVPTSWIGGAR